MVSRLIGRARSWRRCAGSSGGSTAPDLEPRVTPPRDADILERLRALERAARPLEPGATRRRRLRDAVVASSERFLRRIEFLKAFEEMEQPGRGLLDVPISEHGLPVE